MGKAQTESVEDKILRCARAGEPANFKDDTVGGVKPVVSAKFLTDLWLGMIDGPPVHPFGIAIAGVTVDGQISLGGARIDHRMRSPLVGFMAYSCDFPNAIDLTNARVETMIFDDCTIGTAGKDVNIVLGMNAIEVLGQISISNSTFNGHLDLANCAVDDDVKITKVTSPGAIVLNGAEIRGALHLTRVSCGSDRYVSLTAVDAVIGSYLQISRCSFAGPLHLSHCRAVSILLSQSWFTATVGAGVDLRGAQAERDITLSRSWFGNIVNGTGMSAGGDIEVFRCVGKSPKPGNASMFLPRCRAGQSIRFTQTILHEWLSLESCRAQAGIDFDRVKISTMPDRQALVVNQAAAQHLALIKCRIAGGVGAQGGAYGSYLSLSQCTISNPLELSRTRVAGWVGMSHCGFGSKPGTWSVVAHGLHDCEIVSMQSCYFATGLACVKFRALEVQIEGCIIGASEDSREPELAVWFSEMDIARRLTFGLYRGEDGLIVGNRISGTVSIRNSSIGQDLTLRSMTVERPTQYCVNRSAEVVDLSGARIGGSLYLSPHGAAKIERALPEEAARFNGAVVLDRAKIEGDVTLLGGTEIVAIDEIRRPEGDSADEHRVRRLKRGVALSAIGTRVGGTVDVGTAKVTGIVDLRDADIGIIADSNGQQWLRIGVEPGHLLLDGLIYRDLDDDEERAVHGTVDRRGDAVDRRIGWLALQYPDRRPTAATFVPQPYDQLARFYAQSGNERSRRRVHIARRDLQRQHGGLGFFERAVARLLSLTSGYGYLPGRAAIVLLSLLGLGTAFAWWALAAGGVVAANATSPPSQPFNALLYAIDVAVPVLDLGQDSGWTIAPDKLPGWWGRDWIVPIGLALYRLAGLVLVSVAVLTFSGILREKE